MYLNTDMKKILVIEDDTRLQKLLTDELSDEGYEITVAGDGKEALNLLKEDDVLPDLIILDLRMPRMDGMETMGHLLKGRVNVPVIIHSAYASYKEDPLALAADAYVIKSHDLTELKNKIHEVLADR
jgi:two-component system, response regulator, stage 0 sporulation protein F